MTNQVTEFELRWTTKFSFREIIYDFFSNFTCSGLRCIQACLAIYKKPIYLTSEESVQHQNK